MLWAREQRRQLRVAITLRCIQLGLEEKQTAGEVGSSQVGVSEVGPDQVSQSQVGSSQVSSDEIGPSQVGASEVGVFEVGPDEVGPDQLLLVSDFGAHEFARAQQQDIDVSLVCPHIQFQKRIRAVVRQTFGLPERAAEFIVERVGCWQPERFGQIPEQLMEGPHDGKHREHLLGSSRGLPPVSSCEGDLGHLLPHAETVVDGATPKALLPEAGVNAATEVRLQMGTSLAGVFCDREVRRDGERRCDTA